MRKTLLLLTLSFYNIFLSIAQDLPKDIQEGKCYIKVTPKDIWINESVTIKISDSYTKTTIIPAKFDTIRQTLITKPASSRWVNNEYITEPEIVKEVTKLILVEKEKIQKTNIPAQYKTIIKKILLKKGGLTKWISIDCKIVVETNRLRLELIKLEKEIKDIEKRISNNNSIILSKSEKLELSAFKGYLELIKERDQGRFNVINQDIGKYQLEKTDEKMNFIPNPLDGINIIFYKTKDGVDSNQKVKKALINGLKKGLKNSNKELKKEKLKIIEIFSVSSTSNGNHSHNSNHYKHIAIDIFMLNGIRVDNYKVSKYVDNNWETLKNNLPDNKFKNRNFWKQIETIHLSFDKVDNIRESFGPDYVRKKDKNIWFDKSNKLLDSHRNHFHFSFIE